MRVRLIKDVLFGSVIFQFVLTRATKTKERFFFKTIPVKSYMQVIHTSRIPKIPAQMGSRIDPSLNQSHFIQQHAIPHQSVGRLDLRTRSRQLV